MIAGKLNKKIVIEHNCATFDNEFGEELRAEERRMLTRADVVWGKGRRDVDLEISYDYDVTFIVWIYLYKKISEGDFVHYAGKKFQVISLEPLPETRILYIRCQTA